MSREKRGMVFLIVASLMLAVMVFAESIPFMVSHQGVIKKDGVPLASGSYDFRFAVIDENNKILWSNDGTHIGESADSVRPDNAVRLGVRGGNYSVKLGDTALANMVSITPGVFVNNSITKLRIWFNKPGTTPQRFQPDVQLVSVPYAYRTHTAENVVPGAISTESIGRSQQVKSFFFKGNVDQNNRLIYSVPAGKTLVITDVWVVHSDWGPQWGFRDRNSTSDDYLKFMIDAFNELFNFHIGLNAGIVFSGGSQIYVRRDYGTTPAELIIVLSGYEF